MARLNKRASSCIGLFLIAMLVTACGGGGGSGGGGVAAGPVASASSFSMTTVMADQINNGYTENFTVTGTQIVGGITFNVTGNGTITVAPAVNAVFEGQAALQNTGTISATLTVNGISAPLSETSQSFSTTNYVPLGESNGEYWVMQGAPVIPATVNVGNTGTIGTYTRYSDSGKATVLGTAQISYVVEADTATSAVVNIILREFDNTNTLLLTDQDRWRIDTLGNLAWVSETASAPDFNYVFN